MLGDENNGFNSRNVMLHLYYALNNGNIELLRGILICKNLKSSFVFIVNCLNENDCLKLRKYII